MSAPQMLAPAPAGPGAPLGAPPARAAAQVPRPPRALLPSERAARWTVVVTATICSVAATWTVYANGLWGVGGDELPHLLAARRVWDSATPGFGQIGTYWPPLFHVLELPFAAFRPLYQSGLAGSIPAMLAYVVGTLGAYELGRTLTGRRSAGLLAALAYGANPNLLYLQSVPMMESTIAATLVWAAASTARYARTGRPRDLVITGMWVAAATWAHYSAWLLPFWVGAILVVEAARLRRSRSWLEFRLICFGLVGTYGITLWLLWNYYLQGDPVSFLANSVGNLGAIQAAASGASDLSAFWQGRQGNLAYAAVVVGMAALHVVGPVAVALIVAAVVRLFWRGGWGHPVALTGVGGLFLVLALFVLGGSIGSPAFARASGLQVPVAYNDNVRYALYLVPTYAGLIAVVAGGARWRRAAAVVLVAAGMVWFGATGAVTLPRADQRLAVADLEAAAALLRPAYDGGQVLTDSADNGDRVMWLSQLDAGAFVTEANGDVYEEVLEDVTLIRWVLLPGRGRLSGRITERGLRSLGFEEVDRYVPDDAFTTAYSLWFNPRGDRGRLPRDPRHPRYQEPTP